MSFLFRGYNEVEGRFAGKIVNGPVDESVQISHDSFTSVFTGYEYVEQVIRNTVSVQVGDPAGTNGFNEKNEFVNELRLTTWSVCAVVGIFVKQALRSVNGGAVDVPDFASQRAFNDFLQKYGTAYVGEEWIGGFYFGAYTFHATSRDEQETIVNALQGKGMFKYVKGEADFSNKMTRVLQATTAERHVTHKKAGFAKLAYPADDPVAMANFVHDLSKGTPDHPCTVQVGLRDLAPLIRNDDNNEYVARFKAARSFFCSPNTGVKAKLVRASAVLKEAQYVSSVYDSYNVAHLARPVAQACVDVDTDIKALTKLQYDYTQDPTQNFRMPALSVDRVSGFPILEFHQAAGTNFGGAGDNKFHDMDLGIIAAVRSRRVIKRVQMVTGACIRRLLVTYSSDINSKEIVDHLGVAHDERDFDHEFVGREFITSVLYRTGDCWRRLMVLKLAFTTSKDVRFGSENDGPAFAVYAVGDDERVIGFDGTYGAGIDHVTIVSVKFDQAQWGDVVKVPEDPNFAGS